MLHTIYAMKTCVQFMASHCLENGDISEMSVCALGKFGGRELGFASDIEVIVYLWW